ncbi:DUF2017 family protein [Microbacterium tenebrionis]|uniref:DUF2017 family protein n=1 Tax=Microbacterium tenebrionis TaxID=2830665 RepID=UPI001D0CF7C9|nr:DUF2017 family protein [Microbacterium tenebrionis]
MTARTISFRLAPIEVQHLAALIDQLTEVIAAADGHPDPAVDRLVPAPYPDDPDAAEAFAAATRDDLLDRRTADAAIVRGALSPFLDGDDDPDDEREHVDVAIRVVDIDSWLRTITALRLVIAGRLGITIDDEHDLDDPRFGVYDWLAYRLDGLIAIADGLDDARDQA